MPSGKSPSAIGHHLKSRCRVAKTKQAPRIARGLIEKLGRPVVTGCRRCSVSRRTCHRRRRNHHRHHSWLRGPHRHTGHRGCRARAGRTDRSCCRRDHHRDRSSCCSPPTNQRQPRLLRQAGKSGSSSSSLLLFSSPRGFASEARNRGAALPQRAMRPPPRAHSRESAHPTEQQHVRKNQ